MINLQAMQAGLRLVAPNRVLQVIRSVRFGHQRNGRARVDVESYVQVLDRFENRPILLLAQVFAVGAMELIMIPFSLSFS